MKLPTEPQDIARARGTEGIQMRLATDTRRLIQATKNSLRWSVLWIVTVLCRWVLAVCFNLNILRTFYIL